MSPAQSPNDDTATPKPPGSRATLGVVFATILIDFIGFSVLIPVLPLFAERLGADSVQVGLILSLYALSQLLFLPMWGWVSDRIGRRPVLLVSLLGTAASFVVLALAESIGWIYFARIAAGFFAASIGTAQAVVTDVTDASERAGGMGLIGAAFGAGMIVGPILGGGLASIDEYAPFYGVAILAGLSFVFAWVALPETKPPELEPRWGELGRSLIPTPIRLLTEVHDRRIAVYLGLFFILFTSFSVLEAMGTLFMARRFGKSELDAAIFFAWIGLFLVLTQGVLLRRLVDMAGEAKLLIAGLIILSFGIAAIAVVPSYPAFLRARRDHRDRARHRVPALHQFVHESVSVGGGRRTPGTEQLDGDRGPHCRLAGGRMVARPIDRPALPRVRRTDGVRPRDLRELPQPSPARNRLNTLEASNPRAMRPLPTQ